MTTTTTPREWDVETHPEMADLIEVPEWWSDDNICAASSPRLRTCWRRRGHGGRHAALGDCAVVLAVWGGDEK